MQKGDTFEKLIISCRVKVLSVNVKAGKVSTVSLRVSKFRSMAINEKMDLDVAEQKFTEKNGWILREEK